jgi:predicted amidohydrolase
MRVALIPLKTVPRDIEANIRQLATVLPKVINARVDLVCLPECTFTGYLYEIQDFEHFAEPILGSRTFQAVRNTARTCQVYLCFGMLEQTRAGVYNSAILMDRAGEVVHIHRKVNEQPPFINGSKARGVDTDIGRLGILICGDLFSDEAIAQFSKSLDLLIVPMARSFANKSPDRSRWEQEERQIYLDAVKKVGMTTVIVNSLEIGEEEPSFGGALVVSSEGEILAESPHGSDKILIHQIVGDQS